MGVPIFHVVRENEFGLSGIANPTPGVGRYGGEWGSMRRPIQSMTEDDCSITSGEVTLPEGHTGGYNAEFLQFDLSIVNIGEDWQLPDPEVNPELFTVWPCGNPTGRKQLKEFVHITFTDSAGKVVKEARFCGLFSSDAFLPANGIYQIPNRYPFGGQRIQMNDLPDGTYQIEIKVNPKYGESVPAVVWVRFTGQDIALVPEPLTGEGFPISLIWRKFNPNPLPVLPVQPVPPANPGHPS